MPPPPRRPGVSPQDWTPFNDRIQFETGNFLYTHNQMSAGHIDTLLTLWAASLACHRDTPPFRLHADLYNTIDASPLGDVAWESFSLKYNGPLPRRGDVPSWMNSEFDVWFWDPQLLVKNLLSNPDFKNEFDYAPYHEYDKEGNHRFQDFMSGDWASKQAVHCSFYYQCLFSNCLSRILLFLMIPRPMDLCLYQ